MDITGKWLMETETSWLDRFTDTDNEEHSESSENMVSITMDGNDSFFFDGLLGNMDSIFDDESLLLEFSWDGEAEELIEPIHGRGWIQFGQNSCEGMLFIHNDDSMPFTLTRAK